MVKVRRKVERRGSARTALRQSPPLPPVTRAQWNRLTYAREKLGAAVEVLATSPYDVKGRLHAAWEGFVRAKCSEYPPHLRAIYDEIFASLTRKPPAEFANTRIGATLHRMHLTTASRIAARIVSLEAQLDYFLRHSVADDKEVEPTTAQFFPRLQSGVPRNPQSQRGAFRDSTGSHRSTTGRSGAAICLRRPPGRCFARWSRRPA